MARPHHPPSDTLEMVDSLADRMTEWVSSNVRLVLGLLGGVLVVAALAGGWISWSHARQERASAAVGAVGEAYAMAMGAEPGTLDFVEPANPETARQARETYAARFAEVADEHAGTTAALEARLRAGALLAELGRPDAALEAWQRGLAEAGGDPSLRGLLLSRIARAHEQAGRFAEAAEAHERAAALEGFPLRNVALADAARCWAEAGVTDRALDAYARLEGRDPAAPIPDHVRARLREFAASH